MGEVYSHLSEEERRVIRIEIGNGTIICGIVLMLGRNASTVGREIKRDTWFPSNENESYRPYRPKRLKTGPWTGGCYIAGPAAAQGVYGQINVYGVTTKSERHKRSYWTRTADGNGIGGRKAPVPYGS